MRTRKTDIKWLLLMIILTFTPAIWSQNVTLESNASMGMEGLYFWYPNPDAPVYLFNRNISPKADCFDIVNGYAFLTWYKGGMDKRNLMISRSKLGTNKWLTIEFPETNTLYTGIYKEIDYKDSPGGDSHRTTSLGISAKDGTIHIVFDQHTGALNYRVSKKNIAFAPDSMFVLENFWPKRDYFKAGQAITSCTYPNFITNAAGELILNFRIGTARQGDMTGLYYDGTTWSSKYTIVKGNNVPEQFNTYGNLYYFNKTLYLCGSIRVYGSETENNQGIYYAKSTGQHGNEQWLNLENQSYSIPMSNLLAPFKIAQPLSSPTDDMTSGARLVAGKQGALHFSAQVNGQGIYHYYKTSNTETLVKSTSSVHVSFAAGDRIYGIRTVASTGRFIISSTNENESSWRDDLSFTPSIRFANIVSEYYDGKLYMVASEYKDSDKHPFRFLTFDLGIKKPMISFEIPESDTSIIEGHAFKVKVGASNPEDTISNVKLLINDKLINQIDEAPYIWNFAQDSDELLSFEPGELTFSAVATNTHGETEEIYFTLTVLEDLTKNLLTPCGVQATTHEGAYTAEKAMDEDLETYWSGRGRGASLVFDLCDDYAISRLGIQWLFGDRWVYDFEIDVSSDSINWTNIFSGKSATGSADTQLFSTEQKTGRYLRYIGNGNSVSSQNAIIEMDIYGETPNQTKGINHYNSRLKIYPNPSSDCINLQWEGNRTMHLSIYDMMGNLVFEKECKQNNLLLSKNKDISSGIYMIILMDGQQILGTKKLTIL